MKYIQNVTIKRRRQPIDTSRTIINQFADDVPVTIVELALAMRSSRWTIRRWQEQGYEFQFGRLTTPGHLKKWLEENAHRLKTKSPRQKVSAPEEEAKRMNEALERMRQ
jgi:hypothetical protein